MIYHCKKSLQVSNPAALKHQNAPPIVAVHPIGGQADMLSCLHNTRCKLHQDIANVSQQLEAILYQRPAEGIRQTCLNGLGFCLITFLLLPIGSWSIFSVLW